MMFYLLYHQRKLDHNTVLLLPEIVDFVGKIGGQ